MLWDLGVCLGFRLSGVGGFDRQKFLHLVHQVAPGILVRKVAFLVHQPHGRDAPDSILGRDLVLPALPIEILGPGHFPLLDKSLELLLARIEGDSDNLKALGMQHLVGLLDVGDFRYAGATPSGPKVDQHDLALHIGQVHLAAVDGRELDVNGFADSVILGTLGILGILIFQDHPSDLLNDFLGQTHTGPAGLVVIAATGNSHLAAAGTHFLVGPLEDRCLLLGR